MPRKYAPRRRKKKSPAPEEDDPAEDDLSCPVEGDDCGVTADDDCGDDVEEIADGEDVAGKEKEVDCEDVAGEEKEVDWSETDDVGDVYSDACKEREDIGEKGGDCEDIAGEGNYFANEENGSLVLANHFGELAGDDVETDDSGDDMWDDDKIPDPVSSDDEEQECRRQTRQDEESPDEILVLGKCFSSAAEFKNACLRYSLKTKYNIKFYMSTQRKLGAICASVDKDYVCDWRCYCSYEKSKHKLQIKVYLDNHTCIRSGFSKMLKTSTIAELYEERLRVDPKMTAKEIAADISTIYKLTVTVEQCRKAKTKLSRARRTSHEEHFSRIWDYEAELHRSNKGTRTEIVTVPGTKPGMKQRFDRFYVCFEAQRHAWKTYCRPIIGLDGAFLKWDIKGQLLAAIGRDADNRIVPIAWAVVEIENEVNWDWFVSHLKMDLGLGDGRDMTIISDKQKGLVKAIHNVLPRVEHRLCARHTLGNWKRDSHDMELQSIFWKIARSYTKGDYDDNLAALERMNPGAYQSLLKTNPETWSRAFFRVGSFCNDNLNNLNESFNRTIKEARRKPLLELLEDIRRQCMVRVAKRNIISRRLKTRFTKSAHREIESAITKSMDCSRYISTGDKHEIHYKTCAYSVDMVAKTCGCGKWQLNGIPCEHAACVIVGKKETVEDYVSDFYSTKTWQLTYEHGIQPVQGMKLWPRLNRLPVLPPPFRNNPRGRPSNYARRKSMNETKGKQTKLSRAKRVMTCSNCHVEGHNKSTCQNDSVEPPTKKPRGRPRKDQAGSSQQGTQDGSQVVSLSQP